MFLFTLAPIDLAIMVDCANYAGKDWSKMTQFVSDLANRMAPLEAGNNQIGIISFDREAHLKASLNEHRDVNGLNRSLQNMNMGDYCKSF